MPVRLPTPRTTWGTSTSVTGPVLSIPRDRDPVAGVLLLSAVRNRAERGFPRRKSQGVHLSYDMITPYVSEQGMTSGRTGK